MEEHQIELLTDSLNEIAAGLNELYQKKNNQTPPKMISLSSSNEGKGLHNI